uniref:Large ribosomal subunit protein eL33 n=1 Tax=Panagrolaimus sp. JU765 TaxID=591449 RepID=A0AC34QD56_9BILA
MSGKGAIRRLYVRAIFTGFKRGQRVQHDNTALLKLENVHTSKDARFYLGKRAVYVYRGVKKHSFRKGPKTNIRCIWGNITRVHGNSGVVRAKFHHNLPPQAMGKLIHALPQQHLKIWSQIVYFGVICFLLFDPYKICNFWY